MAINESPELAGAKTALEKIQQFDLSSLPRLIELGQLLNFERAVEPATRIQQVFKGIPVEALHQLPTGILAQIKGLADTVLSFFDQCLLFDPTQQHNNPIAQRDQLIQNIVGYFDPVFQSLLPYISYFASRGQVAVVAQAQAQADKLLKELKEYVSDAGKSAGDAATALTTLRTTATEKGLSTQALQFMEEAQRHETAAEHWMKRTITVAGLLLTVAVLSMFAHKHEWFKTTEPMELAQFLFAKGLVAGVLIYMLVLFAKNYLGHQHNVVVNRHRQNAIACHRALLESTGDQSVRDAIMLQAANCIFTPQSTGYTSTGNIEAPSPKSVMEFMSKSSAKSE